MAEDLIDVIDLAAARLLEMGGFGATTAEGLTKATLPEQIKAFEAVVDWAKTRKELKPPEKGNAKFDRIRANFNSSPRKRRGDSIPIETEPGPPDGAAEPVAESFTESVNGSGAAPDLFNA